MKGNGDFSIGSKIWPGVSKLIEECGEVQQVCGKLMGTGGEVDHWDGTNLRQRLEEELADMFAAARFVAFRNGLDAKAIQERCAEKLALFTKWHLEGDPPPGEIT